MRAENAWLEAAVSGPVLQGVEIFGEAVDESVDELKRRAAGPLTEYQYDPIGFLVNELKIPEETIRWKLNNGYEGHRWDGTEEPLVIALDALSRWENVAVEAGTGTSKTYTLGAGGMLWFLLTWPNARCVTVAPKEDQLSLNLWKEVQELWPRVKNRFPDATFTKLKLRMRGGLDETWSAFGFVAQVGAEEESAGKARGMHAEHMLVIFEEASEIHSAITTAFENTCTAPHNIRLALGNPSHIQDELHKMVEDPEFVPVRISALDYPNIVINEHRDPTGGDMKNDVQLMPGGASRSSVARRARKYLATAKWIYDAMVRGISPSEAKDALIKWEWCKAAAARYNDLALRQGPKALGVDVANSETGDKAALADWLGSCLLMVTSFPCPDNLKLGVRVSLHMALNGIDPMHVGVDSVGVGSGTVNKLSELELAVRALNSGARPEPELETDGSRSVHQEAVFANLRSQMWWQMRDDLARGLVSIPPDEELWRDLTTPIFFLRNGKIYIEAKEEIVKRLGRSPDKGDAAVYGNWVRPRSVTDYGEADPVSAWDREILAREADQGRRVHNIRSTTRPREVEEMLS